MFTFIDIQNLGSAFPMRNLVSNRQFEDHHTVRDRLQTLNSSIQHFVATYIQGEIKSYFDLPTTVQLDEKLELIFIADFPNGWDEYDKGLLESLCKNGPKAGKFVIFQSTGYLDSLWRNLPNTDEINCENFHSAAPQYFSFYEKNAFPQSIITEGLSKALQQEKPKSFIPLDVLSPSEMWKKSAQRYISATVGQQSVRSEMNIWFGSKNNQACAHGALVGMTGSGKSNVYHSFICDLIQNYSPEELQLYLIDGKQGMTFQAYKDIPHAKVIVLQSVNEISANVLKILKT